MIKIDLSKCTGCRSCEVACAFYHSGSVGVDGARIKVTHIYETGIDGPVLCRQCCERYCLDCPQKALKLGSKGQVVASPTLCTLCGKCERRCPIGAIEKAGDLVYVCDLCGGDPRCVRACTLDAIHYEADVTETVSLKEFKKNSRGLDAEQKRLRYVKSGAEQLRQYWLRERRG